MSIIDKYNSRVKKANSLVCVGLDSDITKLTESFASKAMPQFEFNKWIIDQTHEFVSAYKPNIAFYEARGDQGIRELKLTMEYLRQQHPDIFTICDCKRADIGNTNLGYVESLFDWFGFDAITLHPYLGKESLEPFLKRSDKGCIVLCRTSNPGAGDIQDLDSSGHPIWWHVAKKVSTEWNSSNNCMLVVGATYPEEMRTIRELVGDMTFLVPGVGAQGGDIKQVVEAGLNSNKKGLIINSSRGVIFAENPNLEAQKLRDEINSHIK
jgi:orotidine-5'-phosphate decarboxylase